MTDLEIDRISDLPNVVLEHILSFLNTKQAVQTSIISKRWRNLWAFSSRIDIDCYHFKDHRTFLEFCDMVLCRRESSYLHTFLLRYNYSFSPQCDCDHLRRWIELAMKFKPHVCCIEAGVPDCDLIACNLIASTFTCESIETMSLCIHKYGWYKKCDIIPTIVSLPRIKRLYLTLSYLKEDTVTRLFAGCPVLEDLMLHRCSGEFSSIFKQKLVCLSLIDCSLDLRTLPKSVDLPCLKRLRMKELKVDEESFARLLTGCPLLENLSFENCSGKFSNLFRHKLKCLSIWNCDMKTRGDKFWWYIDRAIVKFNLSGDAKVFIVCILHPLEMKFIWDPPIGTALDFENNFEPKAIFSGAECFKLCFPDTKVDLKKELPRIGAFNNIKRLSLKLSDWCMHPHEIDPVIWFFQKSPNIEDLTLYNPKREIAVSRRGKQKPLILCYEGTYYDSLLTELSEFNNLKRVEIKLCKNLFSYNNFKDSLLQKMEDLANVNVVISEYDE
ncbi:F-box family protein [Rhynchospora pubera]|uniref:F-box family protein n=1 Tax=Rhynchospora pubera TaxID=906938 RepID=A0AAV8DN77_9POAL|nr:F-box family protein [Rhynchospora pubera]